MVTAAIKFQIVTILQPGERGMASLTIKGIPPALLQRLRERAARHRRSINGEVLHLLERELMPEEMDAATALGRIDARRERLAVPPLTDALPERWKTDGRE
jgi:antitoxin FitA